MGALGLLSAVCLALAGAVQLPSAPHGTEFAEQGHNEAPWSFRLEDQVYFAPPTSMAQLSTNVSHYYYTIGSEAALTDEMKARRVGGKGRLHILHLPEGPKAISLPRNGDRRSGFSALMQLKGGAVLAGDTFPKYVPSVSPHSLSEVISGSEKTQLVEAASVISGSKVNAFLSKLVRLGTDGSASRSWTNAAASDEAEEFLTNNFKQMGLTTCLHTFTSQGRELANVVAYLPGTGGAGKLVVGAHYDSRPFDRAAPGAEDNGSGIAALLGVATAFMSGKVKPQRDVYFVGFAAEEPGLLGSKAFASALQGEGSEIPAKCRPTSSFLQARTGRSSSLGADKISAIILDEVGWVTPKFKAQTINLESYDWPETVELMDDLYNSNDELNSAPLEVTHSNNPFGSDHMSFLDRGIPAVLIINGDDQGYPNYHKSTDTIDNVNMEYTAKVSKLVFGAAVRTAGKRP